METSGKDKFYFQNDWKNGLKCILNLFKVPLLLLKVFLPSEEYLFYDKEEMLLNLDNCCKIRVGMIDMFCLFLDAPIWEVGWSLKFRLWKQIE